MKVQQLAYVDAVASLSSSSLGLTHLEAARRLREFGPNEVERVAREPAVIGLLKELTCSFSLILWIAAALAFVAEWRAPGQGMARLGYAIVAVILVSSVFSFWQENRAEQALAALLKLLPTQVVVLREGEVTKLSAREIVPGDVILLEPGNNIPADCRLIELEPSTDPACSLNAHRPTDFHPHKPVSVRYRTHSCICQRARRRPSGADSESGRRIRRTARWGPP
jgi:magnesium-transporting ATPase (P-type)